MKKLIEISKHAGKIVKKSKSNGKTFSYLQVDILSSIATFAMIEKNDFGTDSLFLSLFHYVNCVCHSIRSMFRVLGIYNFDTLPKPMMWSFSSETDLLFLFAQANLGFSQWLELAYKGLIIIKRHIFVKWWILTNWMWSFCRKWNYFLFAQANLGFSHWSK